MFKKAFYALLFSLILIGGTYVSACMDMRFDDADICIDIDKDGNDYELDTDIDANTSVAITCHILLPDGEDRNVSENDCQGEFEYDDEDTEKVKLYVVVNGEYDTLEEYYDFDKGERDDDGGSSSNGDLDDFELDASDTTPEEDTWVDITIEAVDNNNDTITNYDGKVRFSVEEKDGSSRDDASSSDYDLDSTYYNFDSDDDGEVTLDELIRITTDEGEFRLKVYDDDDNDIYEYIELDMDGTSSSDGDLDNFDFDISDSSPERDDKVEILIEALDDNNDIIDDYDDEVTLLFEIRDGSSRTEADDRDLEIDSNDFSDDETDLDKGELTVDFKDGELEFDVRFDESEEYRITVEDENENVDEDQEFDVDGTSSSNGDLHDFELDASDTTPEEDERIDLEIEAIDDNGDTVEDYEGKVRFSVMRKDSDGDWITSSSAYYDLERSYYDFDNSDDGKVEIRDLIRFTREYEFKIKVYDDDDHYIYEYIEFDVGNTSDDDDDYNNFDGFELDASPDDPEEGERVDISINAMDDDDEIDENYEGTIKFRVEKKSGVYRNLASSLSYSLDEIEVDMDSADDGELELDGLVKFKEEGKYRLKAYDEDNTTKYGYITFNIGDTDEDNNSDVDGFSNKEYDQVKAIYNIWPGIIRQLESDYYKLRYSSERKNESDKFYEDMNDVIDDDSNKDFDDYNDFFDAFLDRYTLTIETR